MYNLLSSYLVNNQPITKKINDITYYVIQIVIRMKKKSFLCKSEDEWKLCIENLKRLLSFQFFSNVYTLDEKISDNKCASLHYGFDNKSKNQVVVKIIDKSKIDQSNEIFMNEFLILRYLNHPNLVRLHDYYEDINFMYIIMERIQGEQLIKYLIIHEDTLTNKRKFEIMKNIGSAVEYLHSLGIVHRDIKPSNIVMTNNTRDAVAKLIDLGIST
jgi:serine/threonine protein kinase